MQPLPGFDLFVDKEADANYTEGQLDSLVVLIYISILLFLTQLGLAIYNTWAFLIKQKKYKILPLLIFYVLVILLSISRICYSFFFFREYFNYRIINFLLKPIILINLGLVQCWIIYELSLRIV